MEGTPGDDGGRKIETKESRMLFRTISAIGAAALIVAGASFADVRGAAASDGELSSQQFKKQGGPRPQFNRAGPPRVVAPRANFRAPVARGPVRAAPFVRGPGVVNPAFRRAGPQAVVPRAAFRGPGPGWRRPVGVVPFRGMRASFIRGPHRVFRRGVWMPLVGIAALGGIYVAGRQYAPYAYVDNVEGPSCAGTTDDGMCELRMTEVPLETGGAEMQCVAYCPQQ
jgi:hypothetical protein